MLKNTLCVYANYICKTWNNRFKNLNFLDMNKCENRLYLGPEFAATWQNFIVLRQGRKPTTLFSSIGSGNQGLLLLAGVHANPQRLLWACRTETEETSREIDQNTHTKNDITGNVHLGICFLQSNLFSSQSTRVLCVLGHNEKFYKICVS